MGAVMMTGKDITLIALGYVLGCLTAGYYWVRWRTGQDIRRLGSGSVGAKNAGRITGTAGFIVTFLIDCGKGCLAVASAQALGASQATVTAVLLAVVAGHNWPMQLRFHGGKGVATSIGCILAYNPWIGLILAAAFLPLYLLLRSFTLSGLLVFALAPLVVFLGDLGPEHVLTMSLLALLILIAHRKNIREELTRLAAGDRVVKGRAHHTPRAGSFHHEL